MKFGFTKDGDHYTYTTPENEAKRVWTVAPVPRSWIVFGRPVRFKGEYGLLGRHFYPLSVLHNLKV